MYRVLVSFSDMEDSGFVYWLGTTYPRDGYLPSRERILHLQSSKNARGVPIISKKTIGEKYSK